MAYKGQFTIENLLPGLKGQVIGSNLSEIDLSGVGKVDLPAGTTGKFSRTATLVVAAYNALDTTDADYICDGTADDVQIQAAINALPSTGGTVVLSEGTFNITGTITLTEYQSLTGQGVQATIIQSSSDILFVRMGNRQSDSVMRNWMHLEDIQFKQNGSTQTHTIVLIDGGGRGTSIKRVQTEGGSYGFELMDLDRCYFEDISATSPQTAAIFLEVGKENTYGTVTFVNCDTSLGYNNTYGFLVDANADQVSPNALDRINFIGCMMFMSNGLTGCIGFYNKIQMTTTNFIGCLFEQNLKQYQCDGSQSQVSFLGCSFLDSNNVATDVAYLNSAGTFTFRDCRFQQATNCFHAVSGSPIVCLEGKNDNQGNITNLWSGSFSSRMGTDTVFAGDTNLVSGLDNQRYDAIFANRWRGDGTHPMAIVPSVDGNNVIQIRKTDGNTIIQEWDTQNGRLVFPDGINQQAGTTTGTKIGVTGGASGEKWSFFGATPIVQPVLATGASHTVDDVITVLQNLGLVRQS